METILTHNIWLELILLNTGISEWPRTRLTCTVYGRKWKNIIKLPMFYQNWHFSSNQLYFHHDVRTRIQSWAIHWLECKSKVKFVRDNLIFYVQFFLICNSFFYVQFLVLYLTKKNKGIQNDCTLYLDYKTMTTVCSMYIKMFLFVSSNEMVIKSQMSFNKDKDDTCQIATHATSPDLKHY